MVFAVEGENVFLRVEVDGELGNLFFSVSWLRFISIGVLWLDGGVEAASFAVISIAVEDSIAHLWESLLGYYYNVDLNFNLTKQ